MAITKLSNQYYDEVKKYAHVLYDEAQGLSKKNPIAACGLGIALWPMTVAIQSIVQNTLHLSGMDAINMMEKTKTKLADLIDYFSYDIRYTIRSHFYPIGKQLFFAELIQNYLLDKQLSKVVKKVAPNHVNFIQTTQGKILRVVVTSLLDAGLAYLDKRQATVSQCGGLINSTCIQVPYHSTSYSIAAAINVFIGTFVACGSREMTGSNLPGMAISWLRSYEC